MEQTKSDMPKYDSYDSPWKEAIEEYLPEFLTLFFANIAEEIEWERFGKYAVVCYNTHYEY